MTTCTCAFLEEWKCVLQQVYLLSPEQSLTFWQVKSLYSVCIGAQDMCTRYWPPVKQEETYGKVQVKNLKEKSNPHYILREFLVHHEEVRWCVVVCVWLRSEVIFGLTDQLV